MLPDGSDVRQLTATVPATCSSLADCTIKIRFVTRNGTGPRASFNPAWSPDGARIAFPEALFRPSRALGELATLLPDGTDPQGVSQSPRFEFRPDWGAAA